MLGRPTANLENIVSDVLAPVRANDRDLDYLPRVKRGRCFAGRMMNLQRSSICERIVSLVSRWTPRLLVVLAIGAQLSWALNPVTPLRYYLLKTWTTKDGLPQTAVTALLRSRLGYMWLATRAGIARFDGATFTIFNAENTPGLPNSLALSLLEDRQGRLWVGLYEGLAVVTEGKATSFPLSGVGLGDSVVQLREGREGVIWARTLRGDLYAIRDGRVREHISKDSLGGVASSLDLDSRGDLWTITPTALVRIQSDHLERYSAADSGTVYATFEDRENIRWAVTSTSVLRVENGRFRKYLQFVPRDLVVHDAVADAEGAIWIGTDAGLYRLWHGKVDTLDREAGLAGQSVRKILPDSDGGVWVASNGGLNYFLDGQFTVLPQEAGGGGKFVNSVVDEPGGGIWLATTNGVQHITSDRTRVFTTRDGLPSNFVNCVARDHSGALWIGTDRGLSRWKDDRIQSFSPVEGVPNANIYSIYETRAGKLLVSTSTNGTLVFGGNRFAPLAPSLPVAYWMTEDNGGNILVATIDGLYRWKPGELTRLGTPGMDYIWSHADADGTIWAINDLGSLSRIRNGSAVLLKGPGSPLFGLEGMLEDEAGNVWLTSTHGLLRVSKRELNGYLDGKEQSVFAMQYTTDDGLPTNDLSAGYQNRITKGLDGKFWFATPGGAVAFDPGKIRMQPAAPRIPALIETVLADGRELSAESYARLSADVMRLEFHYAGIDFRTPQQVRFRYRMENFDRGWMDAGTRRIANYMNLPDGKYTFRVETRNRDGLWNDAGASFAFEIAPHYYRTWWFYLSCAVFVGCCLITAHLLRMAQVRKAMEAALQLRMEERGAIARELHDTLLQGIAGIAMQLRALTQRLPQGEAQKQLGEILNRMERSTKETRLALRDLRLPGETARDLPTALESFGQTMVMDTDQQFEMEVRGAAWKLPGDLSHNLLRIGQEAILNAAKHSGAALIRVKIIFESSGVRLDVIDNGKGFDPNGGSEGGHWGLVGMRERAKRVGGRLEIQSGPGVGTRISVAVARSRS